MQMAKDFTRWVGVEEGWVRPRPTSWRPDLVLTVVVSALVVLEAILQRSMSPGTASWWEVALVGVAGAFLLLPRRRWPLPVMLVSGLWLFAGTSLVPDATYLVSLQFACFYAVYSGAAWATDRQLLLLVAAVILAVVVVWIAWSFAAGAGIERVLQSQAKNPAHGPMPPVLAWVVLSVLMNLSYFVGAFTMGTIAWRQARDAALIVDQAQQIAEHQIELRDQAIVEERLRIARELHDVVAHHVSVMGIQASAARRVMDRDPVAAQSALTGVEESARQAVGEMRNLLGTLRSADGSTQPQPKLDKIIEFADPMGPCRVAVQMVGDHIPVPEPVGLSLYRIAQESLNNVHRHSTARNVSIVVRRDPAFVEIEVVDDGHPKVGTSGTGLGQEGIRERVAALRGSVEIGPRQGADGYRVRARIPLTHP